MFNINITIENDQLKEAKNALIKKDGKPYTWKEIFMYGLTSLLSKQATKNINRKLKK